MADTAVISLKRKHQKRLANRIVAPLRGDVKTLLLNARQTLFRDPAILDSHVIPPEALDRLAVGDDDGFIALREEALIERERLFAKQYVNLPEMLSEDEPDIDVDEDDGESLDEDDDFA